MASAGGAFRMLAGLAGVLGVCLGWMAPVCAQSSSCLHWGDGLVRGVDYMPGAVCIQVQPARRADVGAALAAAADEGSIATGIADLDSILAAHDVDTIIPSSVSRWKRLTLLIRGFGPDWMPGRPVELPNADLEKSLARNLCATGYLDFAYPNLYIPTDTEVQQTTWGAAKGSER